MQKVGLARQVHCAKIATPEHEDQILPVDTRSEFLAAIQALDRKTSEAHL